MGIAGLIIGGFVTALFCILCLKARINTSLFFLQRNKLLSYFGCAGAISSLPSLIRFGIEGYKGVFLDSISSMLILIFVIYLNKFKLTK